MDNARQAFATCPKGLESLLLEELRSLGADALKETVAGVGFAADIRVLYRICLWSRLANRVHLQLARFEFRSEAELYAGAREIDWAEHMDVDTSFAIDCTGSGGGIDNSRYGALRVKDALADYFRAEVGRRPSVDAVSPGIRVHVRLRNLSALISLDLSGDSLHRRGYRTEGGVAPLKENLASALLIRAGWPQIALESGALIDPLCGSGTLLVEACQIAMGIAPGLIRAQWGFDAWLGHVPRVWSDVIGQAREQQASAMSDKWPDIIGYDGNNQALHNARRNIERANLSSRIKVYHKPLEEFSRPTHKPFKPGLVIANPPYGIRLGNEAELVSLYRRIGMVLKTEFCGWQAGLITGNPELGKTMGLRASKQYRFYNGPIPSRLLLFDVTEQNFVGRPADDSAAAPQAPLQLSKGAQMFANRLSKNLKRLRKWQKRSNTECYRLYDADMPEYAVALDIYADWVHVAEYRAPVGVAEESATQRLRDVMIAIPEALGVAPERVVLKQRAQQRGTSQYAERSHQRELLKVREDPALFQVNLNDYLDTGLFLDHRLLRRELGRLAEGQSFLNLFCYTATATVNAALGGASHTTSVDMSSTYLDWARRNFALNGLDTAKHELVRADCTDWIENQKYRYDIVLLDPPTFSNSKRMDGTFDVQRDHGELIKKAMNCVKQKGLLIFTTHRRRFELDTLISSHFSVEDVAREYIDEDFARSRQTHGVWHIKHSD